MSGIMLDSTNSTAIIEAVNKGFTLRDMKVRAAALYADGKWAALPAAFSVLRRLGVKTADITVSGNPNIKAVKVAADVEPGDLTPGQAAQWAAEEVHNKQWPVIYCNRSNKPDVIKECVAQGIEPAKDFGLWVATLDGTFTDTGGADLRHAPGVVAVQFADAKMTGIDADASAITAAGEQWLNLPPSWSTAALAVIRGAERDLAQLRGIVEANA